MAAVTIPYKPRYPEVHAQLESHRFCVLVAHRRFGKTVLSINHLLKQAILCPKPRGSYGYVGPLRNQAKVTAWKYLKHYSKPIPGCRVNESELSITLPNDSTIRIFGADNPDALRGFYFDGVILDEVAQMKAEVWSEVIQPALADRLGWALFIGTPKGINLFSEIYYAALAHEADGDNQWKAMCFPVTETNALDAEEVQRLKADLSENTFRQEMLCDFTVSSDNVLIGIEEVTEAMERRVDIDEMGAWPVIVGVDVARFGDDATVFFSRRGLYAYDPIVINHLSNAEVAHRLMAYIAQIKPMYVCIDQGQGTGVIDWVRELTRQRDVSIIEVPFGSAATHDDLFVNRRAEMWTSIRDWIRAGGRLPKSEWLKAELTAPIYEYDVRGRIKLEAKESIKERLRRSTDLADALALTFAIQVSPDRNSAFPKFNEKYGGKVASRIRDYIFDEEQPSIHDWDPFKGQDDYDLFK